MKFLALICIGAVLLSAACAAETGQKQEPAGEPQEIQTRPEDREHMVSEQDWDHTYVLWPEEIPGTFPPYKDGDLIETPFDAHSYPNILAIENTSIEAVQAYVENALDQGYVLEWEAEKVADEDASWVLHLETDQTHYGIILAYFEAFSESTGYLTVTLSKFDQ